MEQYSNFINKIKDLVVKSKESSIDVNEINKIVIDNNFDRRFIFLGLIHIVSSGGTILTRINTNPSLCTFLNQRFLSALFFSYRTLNIKYFDKVLFEDNPELYFNDEIDDNHIIKESYINKKFIKLVEKLINEDLTEKQLGFLALRYPAFFITCDNKEKVINEVFLKYNKDIDVELLKAYINENNYKDFSLTNNQIEKLKKIDGDQIQKITERIITKYLDGFKEVYHKMKLDDDLDDFMKESSTFHFKNKDNTTGINILKEGYISDLEKCSNIYYNILKNNMETDKLIDYLKDDHYDYLNGHSLVFYCDALCDAGDLERAKSVFEQIQQKGYSFDYSLAEKLNKKSEKHQEKVDKEKKANRSQIKYNLLKEEIFKVLKTFKHTDELQELKIEKLNEIDRKEALKLIYDKVVNSRVSDVSILNDFDYKLSKGELIKLINIKNKSALSIYLNIYGYDENSKQFVINEVLDGNQEVFDKVWRDACEKKDDKTIKLLAYNKPDSIKYDDCDIHCLVHYSLDLCLQLIPFDTIVEHYYDGIYYEKLGSQKDEITRRLTKLVIEKRNKEGLLCYAHGLQLMKKEQCKKYFDYLVEQYYAPAAFEYLQVDWHYLKRDFNPNESERLQYVNRLLNKYINNECFDAFLFCTMKLYENRYLNFNKKLCKDLYDIALNKYQERLTFFCKYKMTDERLTSLINKAIKESEGYIFISLPDYEKYS